MTDIKRVGDSGIHTVEGTVAGRRAALLTKERDQQRADYEALKAKIKAENAGGISRIDDKFAHADKSSEANLPSGLITAEEIRLERERGAQTSRQNAQEEAARRALLESQAAERKKIERNEKRKKQSSALSFDPDAEGGEDGEDGERSSSSSSSSKKSRIHKDPTAETSFLPDRDRDAALEAEKARLREEWLQQQEQVKNEFLEVVYSYWDGTGHRKEIRIRKGTTIGRFLELVKQQIAKEHREILAVSSDSLMYIKEDLIIPHHFSFYDLIVTKARGKSGPLFHFDVHDDVRLLSDARVEKDESHPGKVVERRWYEKNRHIFPASRWEVYDPAVSRERYTIHGGEVNQS